MSENKNSGWKNTILNIAVFLGLIGTIFGMNKYFVLKEVYEAKCEASAKEFNSYKIEVAQSLQAIQSQIQIQRAYDEVYYWQKTVNQLTQSLAQNPNNGYLKVQLNNARTRLQEAENRLRRLQGK